jgi:hypothetical protein
MCVVVCKTILESEHAILTTLYITGAKNIDNGLVLNSPFDEQVIVRKGGRCPAAVPLVIGESSPWPE